MENYIEFNQGNNRLILTTKTVAWLVSNTDVDVFKKATFDGYQRDPDLNHANEIASYLEESFYLPSAIICSLRKDDYSENERLFIVDGQHRVYAFKKIKEENPSFYAEIENIQLPIIVLLKPDLLTEIDTFITINKKAKKVDTSLAFVLKNKLNRELTSEYLSISRKEYIAVEVATNLCDMCDSVWKDEILFEGNPKKSLETISLNAFVRSARTFFSCLERHSIIEFKWSSDAECDEIVEKTVKIIEDIWKTIRLKWESLFSEKHFTNRIIQGAIGFSSINKLLIYALDNFYKGNKNSSINFEDAINEMKRVILECSIDEKNWEIGGTFSVFTSESGYSKVAETLKNAIPWIDKLNDSSVE